MLKTVFESECEFPAQIGVEPFLLHVVHKKRRLRGFLEQAMRLSFGETAIGLWFSPFRHDFQSREV